MQSVQSGYLTRTSVILVLCMFDCCINAVADHPSRGAESFMPYVFLGVQVALQVINLLLIFMLFSGTYLFQVGLVGVQVREFRGLLGCALLYLLVYIAYAAYKIVRALVFFPAPLVPTASPAATPLFLPSARPSPHTTFPAAAAEPHTQRGRGWPVGRARLCLSVPYAKACVAPLLPGHAGHLQPHGRDSVVQPRELDSKVQRGHVGLAVDVEREFNWGSSFFLQNFTPWCARMPRPPRAVFTGAGTQAAGADSQAGTAAAGSPAWAGAAWAGAVQGSV